MPVQSLESGHVAQLSRQGGTVNLVTASPDTALSDRRLYAMAVHRHHLVDDVCETNCQCNLRIRMCHTMSAPCTWQWQLALVYKPQ